jgi:hypothetical protein
MFRIVFWLCFFPTVPNLQQVVFTKIFLAEEGKTPRVVDISADGPLVA